jgi:hypothetical protein
MQKLWPITANAIVLRLAEGNPAIESCPLCCGLDTMSNQQERSEYR